MSAWLLSLLVSNHFGVLTRVAGLFTRRGYNIASLSVGETHDPALSLITIQTRTDGAGVHQIVKQLSKLEDVKSVQLLPGAETVSRELLLVKLLAPPGRRERLTAVLTPFSYQTAYQDERKLILEFVGDPARCQSFLDALEDFTFLELARTGITALPSTGELHL